ncbi:protein gp37 [Methylosinus sp. sav-2]|uniref:DUF5131 family protein n=1 Tax=Methylosinus sp. sav-2 TaxID=2485168 RepID=UPI000479005F|nr:DUF5131 family protein [Methylosinus sp. sav-2]TDX64033.1 protein gp37 [Methylosinus sp. sav-2]
MAEKSAIEWTDATWNIVTGCSLVSPACTNCYAMRLAGTRMKGHASRRGLTREVNGKHVWTGEVRVNWEWIELPFQWARARKIFVAAHGDLFHAALSMSEIATIFAVMVAAHHLRGHVFQVLTKRAERMREVLSDPDFWAQVNAEAGAHVLERTDALARRRDDARATLGEYGADNPPPGIWLGVTVEDPQRADERIPELLATSAAFRFVSCEPLLGAIPWKRWLPTARPAKRPDGTPFLAPLFYMTKCEHCGWVGSGELCGTDSWGDDSDIFCPSCHQSIRGDELPSLDLVIAGGESGPGARSTPIALFRSLRDQCAAAGVAFDFKQWGEWIDADQFLALVAPERVAAGPLTFVGATKLGVDCLAACEHHSDGSSSLRVGKRRAGRLLDGREHNGLREVGR